MRRLGHLSRLLLGDVRENAHRRRVLQRLSRARRIPPRHRQRRLDRERLGRDVFGVVGDVRGVVALVDAAEVFALVHRRRDVAGRARVDDAAHAGTVRDEGRQVLLRGLDVVRERPEPDEVFSIRRVVDVERFVRRARGKDRAGARDGRLAARRGDAARRELRGLVLLERSFVNGAPIVLPLPRSSRVAEVRLELGDGHREDDGVLGGNRAEERAPRGRDDVRLVDVASDGDRIEDHVSTSTSTRKSAPGSNVRTIGVELAAQ